MPKNSDGIHVTVRTEVNPIEISKCVNKLNWKSHPKRQKTYVGDSIGTHGWAGTPLFNANTMNLINGHGRLEIAIEKKYKSIPIDVGWWSEDEERELLLNLDNTSNMAVVDATALSSLSQLVIKRIIGNKPTPTLGLANDIHAFAKSIINKNRDTINIRQSKKSVHKVADTKPPSEDNRVKGTDSDSLYDKELRNDIIFPSSNEWGFPDLLPSKLYTNQRTLPTSTFSRSGASLLDSMYYDEGSRPFDSQHHTKPIGGFLGFFTEDYRFDKYYDTANINAERLIDEQWFGIIEPDYSTYWNHPLVVRQWSVYRSRWCMRYWQQLGIKVIPMIRRTNNINRDAPWLYDTLIGEADTNKNPKAKRTIPIACMQIRMGGKKNQSDPNYWNQIGASLTYCQTNLGIKFILLHGNPSMEKYIISQIPNRVKYRFITPFIDARKIRKNK